MEKTAKVAILIGVLIAFGLWVYKLHPHIAAASVPPIPLVELEPGTIAAREAALPAFQETGVVVYDRSHGAPDTPYFVYTNAKGSIVAKQLIFSDVACDVAAGDAPCAAATALTSSQEPIAAGSAVAVTGHMQDQGVFVDSYHTANVPNGMVLFTATLNQPVTLSNGDSLTFTGVVDAADCSYGEGCFGDGITRATVHLSALHSARTVEMVPGSLQEFSKTTFVPISINGTGANATATFLAIRLK